MESKKLPPFPHHSWLAFAITLDRGDDPCVFRVRSTAHYLTTVENGTRTVRWISKDRDEQWNERPGAVQILPYDGDSHTIVMRSHESCTVRTLLIPKPHLDGCFPNGFAKNANDGTAPVVLEDDVIWRCAIRVAVAPQPARDAADCSADEAARQLIGRLAEIGGGPAPDWRLDASVFQPRTVERLVNRIDGGLRKTITVAELGLHVGLSPSHFAKKFRNSTGYSPQRFINRRRIRGALQSLQDQSLTPTNVATRLGFSSQSHFTRIFSGMTGLTPARYQAQFRRPVG